MKKNVLIFSLLFAFIDQVIKYFVINYLELYKSIKVIPNFFYLTYTQNDGAAFSILSGAFMILYTLFVRGDLDEDIHGRKRIK